MSEPSKDLIGFDADVLRWIEKQRVYPPPTEPTPSQGSDNVGRGTKETL